MRTAHRRTATRRRARPRWRRSRRVGGGERRACKKTKPSSSRVGIFLLGFRARYSGDVLRSATAGIRTVRRQPNSVGLWPARELPKGRRRTDLPFHFSGRPSAAFNPQGPAPLFLPLQSASHLRSCDACGSAHAVRGRALSKEGIMHATLSPSWKKSLLLVFVS